MRRDDAKAMRESGYGMLDDSAQHPTFSIPNRIVARKRSTLAFALYEVLLGVAIFAVGVLALGRAVENCLQASMLNAEEEAVRQILSNRMAEIQAARGVPDRAKESKIDSGYGAIKLIQKSAPADLIESNNVQLNGINLVTLTAQWERGGIYQSKQIRFYVYRSG
jgi:hypothetical protein